MTHCLLPLIYDSVRKDPEAKYGRIVSVTSKGHIHCSAIPYHHFEGTADMLSDPKAMEEIASAFDGIEGEYHNTKMGQLMHAIRVQQIVDQQVNHQRGEKIHIDIATVHPGLVNTQIFQWHEKPLYIRIFVKLLSPWIWMMTRSTEQAADCVMHCVLTDRRMPSFVGGGYHSNCRPFTPGYGAEDTAKLIASDLEKLYNVTMKVLGLEPLRVRG